MSIQSFILTQALIIAPLIAGFLARRFLRRTEVLSRRFIMVNLLLLEPPIILWTTWGLVITPSLALLPMSGLLLVGIGFLLGSLTAPRIGLEGIDRKTFTISSSLANHGFTMGGFICFVLAGEEGLALASVFLVYFVPYTFTLIFTYAQGRSEGPSFFFTLRNSLLNLRNMPLLAALVALSLNGSGLPRPDISFPVFPLVLGAITIYYFALGLTLEPGALLKYKKEHAYLALVKFLALPLLAALFLQIIPLPHEYKRVILIESMMPAAVYSVITSILFRLNRSMASSLFLVNTALFLVIVIPLYFLTGLIDMLL
jgi:hypothetical protein